ncbi:MAG: hypothetical protein A2494_02430 [Candidatus Lloydbacteria bacterium RIFOXYC12_FULL_46_25]|uniref:Thioredoxin domain-containing protein n=1 Tax=Candidatus Lloydbacteria bacterium RIFOXYC12_FULL_46_25 TaxID=1798670 RepID=A0A1G2E1R9_9BACT|nr:MAG: hypothetical protein A2494_02430 [Candidatus Lloydbacteria bacterium RIFOXYC12_FULL_46_25]
MNDKNIIISAAVLLVATAGILYALSAKKEVSDTPVNTSAPMAQFAQCLADNSALFYGAFWCPHCQSQKKLFGNAEKLLPYVECSTPDGNGQMQICKEKGITGYPTWVFADGSKLDGQQSLAKLSEKTGCTLPVE